VNSAKIFAPTIFQSGCGTNHPTIKPAINQPISYSLKQQSSILI
jgi:hypothetical protein